MRLFSSILFIYFSVLTVTPFFCTSIVKKVLTDCGNEIKCPKKNADDSNRDTNNCKSCCLMENCCDAIVNLPEFNFNIEGLKLQKKTLAKKDKAFSDYLSECWHPPEIS